MQQPLRQVLPRRHRAFGLGAMTAALVIVPDHPAGGTRTAAGELPWMVRLSTAPGDITDTAQRELTAPPAPGSAGHPRRTPVRLASVPSYRLTNCAF